MTSTNPLQIGGDSLWGQHFNGTIDEVRVYNVSLTASQIQSDMNTPVGSSGGGNPPTVSSLQCNPNSITSGSSSTCTVTLSRERTQRRLHSGYLEQQWRAERSFFRDCTLRLFLG